MEMAKLTVLVPDDLRRRAKAEAALQGISLSEIVRHALEGFLEDAEDVAVAIETMARIRRGEERTYTKEEVWAELDELPG
jgi:RHH-type rel operon transcriptional repressor/antitoxin RelB